ncbi:MAG: ROK family transcriptional regulator [Eubacteriales bacterium]|nr:ROK family transcriptional regulator [Eubacteriales bacterium]
MKAEQKGKNIADVQRMNRSLVIRTIYRKGRTTRAKISKSTGLNKATVTNIVGDLINWGLVREAGLISGSSGRRSIEIELASEEYLIIGVWLTRHNLRMGVFDLKGEVCELKHFNIGLYSVMDNVIEQMIDEIKIVQNNLNGKHLLGVAVALPGPYIKKDGEIALLTRRREWQNIDILNRLRIETGLTVISEHDAGAATMAEWMYTEQCNDEVDMMCIMVSHGVGAGVIEKGKLLTGCAGLAGEIGHMSIDYDGPQCECGNRGCLELYCTSHYARERVLELKENYPDTICTDQFTAIEFANAYRAGDALAIVIVNEIARYLGYGIANVVNLYNPKKIIIGDEISESGVEFLNVVKETVKERCLTKVYDNLEITLSNLKYSTLQGICIAFMNEMIERPEVFIRQCSDSIENQSK